MLLSLFVFYPESGDNSSGREVQGLEKRDLELEAENNLLKIKIETLLDKVRIEQLWVCP